MPTVSVALDQTQYVRINTALNPMLLQAPRDTVRITLSELKPSLNNTVYHTLGGQDEPLQFHSVDVNVWALSMSDRSSLIVTETTDIPVTVSNVVDVSETELTLDTDVVTVLNDISRKLNTQLKYWAMFQKVELEEDH